MKNNVEDETMNRLELIYEQITDFELDKIKRYIQGERVNKSQSTRREREDVSYMMVHLINDECGIHSDGIELGEISPARYKREKKRRERYWKKVRDGQIIDSRRGYDKYRKEKMR